MRVEARGEATGLLHPKALHADRGLDEADKDIPTATNTITAGSGIAYRAYRKIHDD